MKLPKTRSLRRKNVTLPGGRRTIQYKKRNPHYARDPITKKQLIGIPRLIHSQLRKLPKNQRRPNRPYGGVLSSSSLREKIFLESKKNDITITHVPIEVGRLVIKTAGRDANKIGAIVDILGSHEVLIDGQVRRRKSNIAHIETLDKMIKIKAKAPTEMVLKELEAINIFVKKSKPKEKKEKPERKKLEKVKQEKPKEKVAKKKSPKKETIIKEKRK